MADNVTIKDAFAANIVVSTDDVGGIQVQRNKVTFGDDGAFVDASSLNPVPTKPGLKRTADYTAVAINVATSGDNTLVAGTGGQTIRVYGWFFATPSAVNIKFKDGASTDFFPAIPFTAGGSWDEPMIGEPFFVTTVGNAFVMNLSANVQVSGRLYYTKD